jgi:hypothetical protein
MTRLRFLTYPAFFAVAAISISQFIASAAIAGNKCRSTNMNCHYTGNGTKTSHGTSIQSGKY